MDYLVKSNIKTFSNLNLFSCKDLLYSTNFRDFNVKFLLRFGTKNSRLNSNIELEKLGDVLIPRVAYWNELPKFALVHYFYFLIFNISK